MLEQESYLPGQDVEHGAGRIVLIGTVLDTMGAQVVVDWIGNLAGPDDSWTVVLPNTEVSGDVQIPPHGLMVLKQDTEQCRG